MHYITSVTLYLLYSRFGIFAAKRRLLFSYYFVLFFLVFLGKDRMIQAYAHSTVVLEIKRRSKAVLYRHPLPQYLIHTEHWILQLFNQMPLNLWPGSRTSLTVFEGITYVFIDVVFKRTS